MKWYEVDVDDIPILENGYADFIRDHATRYGTPEQRREWDCFDDSTYGVAIFDAATKNGMYKPIQRGGGYNGIVNISQIPWSTRWRIPTGSDTAVIIRDYKTGVQYGVWAVGYAGTLFGQRVLIAGAAYQLTKPMIDYKGRIVDSKKPLDFRTWPGNCKMAMGSGVIPRPVEQSHLDAEEIPFALSAYMSRVLRGSRGFAVAPAGQYEQAAKTSGEDGMTLEEWNAEAVPSGTRFSWSYNDDDLERHIRANAGRLTLVDQRNLRTIMRCLRKKGATIDATGPNGGFIFATHVPQDLLHGVIDFVKILVHEVPYNRIDGLEDTRLARWSSDIYY